MPMFFPVLVGIIPLSLRNGEGAFDTVCPLVCKWEGNCPFCPVPRLSRLWIHNTTTKLLKATLHDNLGEPGKSTVTTTIRRSSTSNRIERERRNGVESKSSCNQRRTELAEPSVST